MLSSLLKQGRGNNKREAPVSLYRDIFGQLRSEKTKKEFKCSNSRSYWAVWKNRKIDAEVHTSLLAITAIVLDKCSKEGIELIRKSTGTNDPFFWVQGFSEQLYPANQWIFDEEGKVLDINENAVKEWYEYEKKIKNLI